ncbi:UNVERIFIED_CONTAM: hypothetical protein GTU68_039386 [Idotea baltica]|nr:hypothetical protein [Idotea baltica]
MSFIFKLRCLLQGNFLKQRVTEHVIHRLPINSPVFHLQRRTLIGSIKHNKKEKPLSNTSIIVQDGLSILELPCIVQVINGEFQISSNGKTDNGESYVGMGLQCHHVPKTLFKNIDFEEESEMALGFMRCNSVPEVFNLLNTCPEEEVTPSVALAVIRRIFDLENNIEFRNQGYNQYPEESNFTFTRSALIKRLLENICASTEPQVIIDTLRSMGRDTNKGDKWNYLEQLCTESIILATDGKLTVNQVCDVIKAFHSLGNIGKEFIEKVWVGINEKTKDIGEEEICNILSVLPLVKNSRMYLYNIVERRVPMVWHKLKPDHVIKIVYVLVQLKISSNRLLSLLSRWTNLNIHRLTEGNLRWIVYSFLSLQYTDENIQQALSRYLKAKKTSIKDYSLVSVILEYCNKMRVRHPSILDLGAEYYMEHWQTIPASQISVIMNCYGHLNYTPPEPSRFFQILESQIDEKFSQFPPNALIDIFLSCSYLKRYPLNFVRKVFNPNFFDRLQSLDDNDYLSIKEKLILLDTVLTFEASNYSGPILPRNYLAKNFSRDARTQRCVNKIKSCLVEIVGNEKDISRSVILPSLPPINLFVIDCIADATNKLYFSNLKLNREKYAISIALPEHYDITEKILVGPHSLKERLIKRLGFHPVSLNYRTVNKLFMYPNKLKEYILQEMIKASDSGNKSN